MNFAAIMALARWVWNTASKYRSDWRAWVLALIGATLLAVASYLATMPPSEPDFPVPYVPGWQDDPETVKETIAEIEKSQGFPADFGRVFLKDPFADETSAVFFWTAEEKVLGKVLPSWNQGNVGSCVSFGWGRGSQDLILIQILATKNAEEWPGAEVATEPIYGGSRVEVGGGRIGGDGSTGAWAAKWVSDWGILFRKKYGNVDLTTYDTTRCRAWGKTGVPNELEPVAKEHPVKGVAVVSTASQAWDAIGSGYPIPCCSNVGFQSPLKEGYCARKGSWAHCMTFRGRFVHPSKGKSFIIQNSWGDYLKGGDPKIEVKGAGSVTLPQGCFAITEADAEAILRQRDSYAISSFRGFPARKLDWLIRHPRPKGAPYAVLHADSVRDRLAGDLLWSSSFR